MAATSPPNELLADPLLRDVPVFEGHKVLSGVVLYARIGQGGMGVVYRGRHCLLDVDLAVKVLKPSLAAEDPRLAQRFLREAQVAARITHGNVVRLYDVKQEHGLSFLSMEFVDGENARARIERKGALGEAEALGILLGAASGLAEAHRGHLVHRDVKPDNVLVARDGRVKVADLGLVRLVAGEGSVTLGSAIMGTPQFMPPEQWESPDVTAAADVWALGATAWFLLAGRAAWDTTTLAAAARRALHDEFPSLRTVRPGLREEVYALVARCVARDPAERFADARALVAALLPLRPADESALADGAAGAAGSRSSWPTPPPRATLERIRDALGTGTQPASQSVLRSEAATVLSPGGTVAMPPPGAARRRRWPAAVVAVLALGSGVAWYGYEAGWFADSEWEATEKLARARSLWERAQGEVRDAATLDAGITTLEEVVLLQPDFAAARTLLAEALDRRAGLVLATDPDAAYTAATRAVELHPGHGAFAERQDAARTKLLAQLRAGLALVEPAAAAVVEGQRVRLRGRVAPGAVAVRVTAHRIGDAPPEPQRVPVVAGEFAAELVVGGPGPCMVAVGVEDRHGLVAGTMPRRAFTTGAVGAPGWVADPRANPQPVVHNAAGITMQPVPVRSFLMGASRIEDEARPFETQHEVTLTQPFWLGATEVTRAQWARLMGTAPWREGPDPSPGDEPVIQVTYAMAEDFAAVLTQREAAAGRLPAGYRYCLPTEAQWELAAHGGGYRMYVHGSMVTGLEEHAVFGEPVRFAAPVATKQPNAFGLYDLAGNVDEWCADLALVQDGRITTLTWQDGAVDPLGNVGPQRIVRGGNYGSPASDCRNAARFAAPPDTARDSLGFRIALAPR